MKASINRLLAVTALCAPAAVLMGAPVTAQQQGGENSCAELEQYLESDMPEGLSQTEQELNQIISEADPEACSVVNVEIERLQGGDQQQQAQDPSQQQSEDQAQASESESEQGQLAETARTRVELEENVIIEGEVFVQQEPPQVEVEGGETEVMVQTPSPDVAIREQAGEIVVREAASTIRVEMPQPTITIERQAPEIIVTMPPPGVDVSSVRPQVEVRQADPNVRVSQTNPSVELQLTQAENPEESEGIAVRDRASGEELAQGQTVERQDAQVNVTSAEPVVTYQEGEQQANVQIERAQPQIRYETSDPQVEFTSAGEPQVEVVQTGEPTVTFREASAEGEQQQDTPAAGEEQDAAAAVAGEEPEQAAQMQEGEEQPEAGDQPLPDAEIERAAEGEQQESPEADAELAVTEVEEEQPQEAVAGGPMVEREGYEMVSVDAVEVENLTGTNVYGVDDENVGNIADLIVSDTGEVQSVLVEVGGFLGIGGKQVEMSLDALTMLRNPNTDDLRVYVDATREEIENMPDYEG